MENQTARHLFDCERGLVVRAETVEPAAAPPLDETALWSPEERYHPLPAWTSADGFALMARFVDSVSDEALRRELSDVLSSRRGVFRAFKDVLMRTPTAAAAFDRFRRREMAAAAATWHAELAELRGLDVTELGHDDEEWADLAATEFSVVWFETDAAAAPIAAEAVRAARDLERRTMVERWGRWPPAVATAMATRALAAAEAAPHDSLIAAATDPEGTVCGVLRLLRVGEPADGGASPIAVDLFHIAVDERYRGVGVAHLLLAALGEYLCGGGADLARAQFSGPAAPALVASLRGCGWTVEGATCWWNGGEWADGAARSGASSA